MINLEKIISLDCKNTYKDDRRKRKNKNILKESGNDTWVRGEEEWQSFIMWIYTKKILKGLLKTSVFVYFMLFHEFCIFFAKNKNLMFYKTLICMSHVGYFHTSWFMEYKRVCKLGLWSSKGSGLYSPLG